MAVRALDDYTFQFELTGPAPYVLGMLPHYAFAVVPMHAIEKYGDAWTRPENFVGNGPFTLDSWIPQDKIVMSKNASYWDAGAVGIDQLIFYPIDDENTSLNMFLQGDIDWIETVPSARLDEMKLRDDYHNNASFVTYYYEINHTMEPFSDVRVRKALAMAIDRQAPQFGLPPFRL